MTRFGLDISSRLQLKHEQVMLAKHANTCTFMTKTVNQIQQAFRFRVDELHFHCNKAANGTFLNLRITFEANYFGANVGMAGI